MDILLNDNGDIAFDNGDAPLVTDEQRQDVAQRLQIKLRTFAGEWFLNTSIGVPYDEQIFGKGRKKSSIDLIFQTQILEEPDVLEITQFDSVLDNANRHYSLVFRVRTESGVTEPIIV